MAPDEQEHAAEGAAELVTGPGPIVFLRGEVDVSDVDELELLLRQVTTTGRTVVVDMADTTFVDAAVLGALVGAHARLGGRLKVRAANPFVSKIFRMVSLGHLLAGPAAGGVHEP